MSHQVERDEARDVLDFTDDQGGRTRRLDFRGPTGPFDGHDHANDHFALIYEDEAERYATAIPFIREGLDQGERCLYVVDERTEERHVAIQGLREAGVDVDAALESGTLTFYTAQETYLRTQPFDPEEMVAFYADAVEEAAAGYTALRVVAGTDWIEEIPFEAFMEYEGRVNALFERRDAMALCMYDRDRLSSSVIRDVIRTHPHLISEGTICENFYYTPPGELFGTDEPDREVNRLLGTLRDRAVAKVEVAEHQQFLRELNGVMASTDQSFEAKLQSMFELGCERFDLDLGAMARVDVENDWFQVEHLSDDHEHFEPGVELPLSETYCTAATDIRAAGSVSNPQTDGYDDITVYEDFGIQAYLGTYIEVEGDADRTFFFVGGEPRTEDFTDDERSFVRLMGQWAKYELQQHRRERNQRTLYEIAADTDRTFEEKLQALFELGCDRFGMELGGLARIDVETDTFEVECVSGDHDHLVPGEQCPLSETYCHEVATDSGTVAITDPDRAGYEGRLCYDRFGVQAYLGTRLALDGADDRTFWFVSQAPRETGFSAAERTFHHLMGQWVQYELERKQHETALEESIDRLRQTNNRLEQFAYAASHDLQEPLRMVSSYLQLLEDQYRDNLDEDAQEYIDFAVSGADRMRSMIEGLLAFARVEQRNGDYERVDCNSVLERVQADLRVQINEANAAVTVEPLPTIVADQEQLEQLFSNLVSNAIKYNDEASPHATVTADQRGDHWAFSVADNGIGIDPAKTDQVFEVFNRLHHDDEYPGTGIGLALCQEIVENHGGTIEVESAPGEGSSFTVTLPRSAAE